MGNILKIFFQQPQIDTTPKVESPICYLPCRQFKKLHKNPNGRPAHFACIRCRNELFKYWNLNKCPIGVTPFYTISHCSAILVKKSKNYPTATVTSEIFNRNNQFVCSV